MLSDRISKLFQLLQCTNTDIARFAGCSPSNISRLKSGMRTVGPESRSVQRLAEGVYRYADYENMLSVLCELCGTEDRRAEALIPALLTWMYEESDFTPTRPIMPQSKKTQALRRRSFGERLDQIMTLLELSNGQLASSLNVDDSLVSRYRSGIYHPNRNERIKEKMSENLLLHAEKKCRTEYLAELCAVSEKDLTVEVLADWLFGTEENSESTIAETLFRSIDMFTPGMSKSALSEPARVLHDITLSNAPSDLTSPPLEEQDRYWGNDGLRRAVTRFLTNTARKGGDLLLYSDEPMDWLTEDPTFFAQWASLMVNCVRNGVHIKIIHNTDRAGTEMASAISGWFPLYISGMIEPYLFRKMKNPRFHHTLFLRPNGEAILGFFPEALREMRWYDYISDRKQLDTLESGYQAMLAGALPFLKAYPTSQSDKFRRFFMKIQIDKCVSVLSGLSIGTMPRELLIQMLNRSGIIGPTRDEILTVHQMRRLKLHEILSHDGVDEIINLPDRDTVRQGMVRLNLGAELLETSIFYTPEEYATHAAEVLALVDREKNYHLTILPQIPFPGLQICIMHDTVALMRCLEPYAAFVFTNTLLCDSVRDYAKALIGQFGTDRETTMDALSRTFRD